MPTVFQRMRKVKALLGIRVGPGSVILPKEIKKVHLQVPWSTANGGMGAKKFWRNCLPRLQFRNPAIPMRVARIRSIEDPALLTITWNKNASSPLSTETDSSSEPTKVESSTPSADEGQTSKGHRTSIISMRDKTDVQILEEMMKLTGGEEVPPTPVELEELRELAEHEDKAQVDRERSKEHRAELKRQQAMLQAARVEAQEQQA
ncbi:hypothetical protein BDY21DRAFT_335489 [Lineolata rhizophorae]|uniref:Ribosomal protein/NADH dehydrogenase domain-containing protein n=1 Tax=Lineolata rhizophorae TaxID=578093 RepID=A0A6A6P951_9PEZI|nr:hypothetical protein BDY21DRAFT_335489 [Lineolata rhizophorae]